MKNFLPVTARLVSALFMNGAALADGDYPGLISFARMAGHGDSYHHRAMC